MMTVFDSRMSMSVRLLGEQARTPGASTGQVGWVAALVWPTVSTAVVAGALLGHSGVLLLWLGIAGVLAMIARQVVKVVSSSVRQAGLIIDNAPFDTVPYDDASLGMTSGRNHA
jgi:hypothetical protein